MDVKGEVFVQLYNKSKLRNGTKTFLESNFFSLYSQILALYLLYFDVILRLSFLNLQLCIEFKKGSSSLYFPRKLILVCSNKHRIFGKFI